MPTRGGSYDDSCSTSLVVDQFSRLLTARRARCAAHCRNDSEGATVEAEHLFGIFGHHSVGILAQRLRRCDHELRTFPRHLRSGEKYVAEGIDALAAIELVDARAEALAGAALDGELARRLTDGQHCRNRGATPSATTPAASALRQRVALRGIERPRSR